MPQNITISIDGKPQTDLERDLVEVVVDTSYHLPAMFSMVIQDELDDNKLKYGDSANIFDIGKEVKIQVETWPPHKSGQKVKGVLFDGEITSIEPLFPDNNVPQLIVRGYDRAHRLMRGTNTRTFLKQGSDQIVKSIAAEAGLSADCDSCSIKYDYILQANQSNWDFAQARALQEGFQVYVDAKKLFFKKAETARVAQEITLTYGEDLSTFEPRIASMGQLQKVTAIGWDVKNKEAIQGVATTSKEFSDIGYPQTGAAASKKAFGEAEEYITAFPLKVAGTAETLAKARLNEAGSGFIQASGSCRIGDPRIKAGVKLNIKKLGNRFSGKYYVTEARHVWAGGQYTLTFSGTGYSENGEALLQMEKNPEAFQRQWGVVPAIVTNLDDPDKLGRVKVKYPWMPKGKGAEIESDWARLSSPMAGPERGMYFVPEVNDEVLVAFEQGDMNYPYVVGTLWNGKDKIPAGTKDIIKGGKVNQRVIRSRTGHLIILDDTEGEEQIIIQDKTKNNSIVFSCKDKKMTFKCEGDLVFEAGGKVQVTSKSDVSFDAKGKTTLKSTGEINLDSTQKATVKAGQSQLGLEMAGSTLKGLKVDITADTQAALKGNAMVQVQGALVKIN
jgi:uncharacterized protein involved in type VI secretion and phage assembly